MAEGAMKRAVFLDRDGVVNDAVIRGGKPYPPASVEDLQIAADAPEALGRLQALGIPLIVVTNQPDVARGRQSVAAVEAIHDRLRHELPIDVFLSCFHDDGDGCPCRKPKPGLILEGAARLGCAAAGSFLVGDRWRDIEAGQAAGCWTVWIDRGYQERGPATPPSVRVSSLAEAVTWIIDMVERPASRLEL